MSRLSLNTESRAESVVEELYRDMDRRLAASPAAVCPVDFTAAFIRLCMTQSCGKCTPCRDGLGQLASMLDDILDGKADMDTLGRVEKLAHSISVSADCAIGFEAANMVLKGLAGFRSDYVSHIKDHRCEVFKTNGIPCVAGCPAGVDIPGYVSLVGAGRYADAVRLIRKDNPFPTACALICEHPCEKKCRRNMLDAPVNIRGLKRSAVDNAGYVPAPECMPSTGKKVAVIGGGPSGLTAAYFLQLMGHQADVYERRKNLGGMLIYGIPAYRLPRERLKEDIDVILSTGVKAYTNAEVGRGDLTMDALRRGYDAVYIAIGAHQDRKAGLEGEDAEGVLSAVEFLGSIGDGETPDLTGKTVCVIGGGNVAMDCTRSAIRAGAESVAIVYRRRREDMTALPEEVEGAIAEGAVMMDMYAPSRIEKDENGKVAALWASPKMSGKYRSGRMNPTDSGLEDIRIPCDTILVAVGQGVNVHGIEEGGVTVERGVIKAANWTEVPGAPGVFAGGDCVTGPRTAIKAIAAGKVAAANIDAYLGFDHKISADVDIPDADLKDRDYCGRVNMKERQPGERKYDFLLMEQCMTEKESRQEASRCLRCDRFGCGIFKGGRVDKW